VTAIRVGLVDVVVYRVRGGEAEVLMLRRAAGGRNPGSWEGVHGAIDPDEAPVAAARREVREETGIVHGSWYNLSHVSQFYRHDRDEVTLIPAFAVRVPLEGKVTRSHEHDAHEWLALEDARTRATWPRFLVLLDAVERLLLRDDDATLDDVLTIG
jgi:8-oxo-dGTP pyrophosphatase MutT (NUDIX family)